MTDFENVVTQLVAILNGLDASESVDEDLLVALENSCFQAGDQEVINACHFIRHFLDDVDIRERDKAYDQLQRESLRTFVNKLSQRYLRNV